MTELAPQTPPPPARWQFTLRGLLFCLVLLGLVLGFSFRRWEETKTLNLGLDAWPVKSISITTSYRRGWLGAPLKHGREFTVGYDGQLLFEAYYYNGQLLVERRFDPPGVLKFEKRH